MFLGDSLRFTTRELLASSRKKMKIYKLQSVEHQFSSSLLAVTADLARWRRAAGANSGPEHVVHMQRGRSEPKSNVYSTDYS